MPFKKCSNCSAKAEHSPDGYCSSCRETVVKELRNKNHNLETENKKMHYLLNYCPSCLYTCAPSGDFGVSYISPAIKRLLGYTQKDFTEDSSFWVQKIHLEDKVRVVSGLSALFENDYHVHEYRFLAKDGFYRWMRDELTLMRDSERKPVEIIGSWVDITEQKHAENTLKSNGLFLRTLIDSIPELVWLKKPDGTFLDCNSKFERLFGAKKTDIVGKTDYDFVDKELADFFRKNDKQAMDAGIPLTNEEEVNYADDGHRELIETIKTPMYDSEGKLVGVLGIARDITERKQSEKKQKDLEVQLSQAHKMESVGRLAGGVAHDFNNMLGVIIGHTEMLLERVDLDQAVHEDLAEIRKAAMRSADLTRQLLAFARKQTVSPKVLDLNKTVDRMLMMIRRLIGENIELAWFPGKDLGLVNIDPSQIDQILANLCINARDAIADVGKIIIETGNVIFDENYCAVNPSFIPGEFVLLAVSDDGGGMDQKTLGQVFEPFFTTKEVGKGTGLGLSTVYGIVKQNNGFINVYSELTQGTAFKIYLPRHIGKTEQICEHGSSEPDMRGHETILLVEDETAILNMTRKMLERLGYHVLAANSPGEAMRLAGTNAGKIHLLMTDVVMPEMNGLDLAKNILALYPNLNCLFMSGYTANVMAQQGVLDEGICFIQKPFSKKELAVTVRSALG